MKKLYTAVLFLACTLSAIAAGENVVREHRAIWMSPMLSSTWPSGEITESNAQARRESLRQRFATLRSQGINTIYFHTRAHCDATYASSYEPYASSVAGSRGGTPAFDPFGFVVQTAHEQGMEVYAWVNPLRYSAGGTYGNGDPRNYEVSHPDWLLRSPEQIILNPAIPEVRQRVVDICREIAANYDIDGMIFDDYFYHSSIKLEMDADYYQEYCNSVPRDQRAMSQEEWRRENVNNVVRSVRQAVIEERPYAVFAIGPAGRISPDDITDYGLTPGPHGDMNYTGLFADPIKWLSEGLLDFLSPQIYWPEWFDDLQKWYSIALPHFNRHLYTSLDCNKLKNVKSEEFLREIDFMRSHVRPNESGVVFFDLGAFLNYGERYQGTKRLTWGEILHQYTFPYTALAPLQGWRGIRTEHHTGMPARNGDNLVWDAPASAGQEASRYAVYALPEAMDRADFAFQPEYIAGVAYTESFDISANPSAVYGVAVYDRYGRMGAIRFEGCANLADGAVPTGLAPAGGNAADLTDLSWNYSGNARFVVEFATDASFTSIVATGETTEKRIPLNHLASLEPGTEHHWRIIAYAADCKAATSAPAVFTPSRVAITAPVAGANDVPFNPVVAWTPCENGTEYTLEISTTENFSNVVFTATTDKASLQVPQRTLISGMKYFARITASRSGAESKSATTMFLTADRSDYTAPAFANPAETGTTLNTNSIVRLQQWEGMTNVTIEIAANQDFPSRSIYRKTLTDFATELPELSTVRISSKSLEAGKTYYMRNRGGYRLQNASAVKYTPYSDVITFVYSGVAGVDQAETAKAFVDGNNILHLPLEAAVEVFDLAGRLVLACDPANEHSLQAIPAGCYIIRVAAHNISPIKWVR